MFKIDPLETILWKRVVVEDFPAQVEAIQMICADFDNDGTDEIIMALNCSGELHLRVLYYIQALISRRNILLRFKQ